MRPAVLLVDDDQEVLNALTRVLRKDYDLHCYTNGNEALAFYQQTPSPIVISDMRMPEINGAEFLKKIVEINPKSKRIVLTGYADVDMVKDAINHGHISFYLTKPWDNQELKTVIEQLLNELRAEKKQQLVIKNIKAINQKQQLDPPEFLEKNEALETKLEFCVKSHQRVKRINHELLHLSADLIASQNRDANRHNYRVAEQAKALATRLGLTELAVQQTYIAALFAGIGKQSFPEDLVGKKWFEMSVQEQHLWKKHPQFSAELLANTATFKVNANIVKHQFEHVDGSGIPDGLAKDDIPAGAKILAIIAYFDRLMTGDIKGKCLTIAEATAVMTAMLEGVFDKEMFTAFIKMIETPHAHEHFELAKEVSTLQPDMVLSQDVYDKRQIKLLPEGGPLTKKNIDSLLNYQEREQETMVVFVKSAMASQEPETNES